MIPDNATTSHSYLQELEALRQELSVVENSIVSTLTGNQEKSQITTMIATIDKRLSNVRATHHAVMALMINDVFKKSFLQLQLRQIESISDLTDQMFNSIWEHWGLSGVENSFYHLSTAELIVRKILSRIKVSLACEAGTQMLAIPLTNKQLLICKSIYSTPEETEILNAFVSRTFCINHLSSLQSNLSGRLQ